MTDTAASPIPLRTPGTDAHGTTGRWPTYLIGFALATVMTAAAFTLATSHWLTPDNTPGYRRGFRRPRQRLKA